MDQWEQARDEIAGYTVQHAAAEALVEQFGRALGRDAGARFELDPASVNLTAIEAELIEPYLYPLQGPQFGRMLADAMIRRLR
jgi:hypothetical protein